MQTNYKPKNLTIKTVREIYQWAHANATLTEISKLDFSKSYARIPTEKSFEDVMAKLNHEAIPYFIIIFRELFNVYGLKPRNQSEQGYFEVMIRGVYIDGYEHFLFERLEKSKFPEIFERFEITPDMPQGYPYPPKKGSIKNDKF